MARSTAKSASQDPIAILAAQVAALSEQLAALPGYTPAPVATPARKRSAAKPKSKGSKVYTWKPWACAKFGIPAIVGASFAYNGKNGTTDHVVTAVSPDGIVSSVRA